MDFDSFGSCGAVQKQPLTTTPPSTVVGIKAEQHPSGYFDWMRRGADLDEALVDSHPLLTSLPGAPRRRRLLLAAGLAIGTWLLRPWPPFQWLPGWCVGVLLLWALIELVAWLLWPQRSV